MAEVLNFNLLVLDSKRFLVYYIGQSRAVLEAVLELFLFTTTMEEYRHLCSLEGLKTKEGINDPLG